MRYLLGIMLLLCLSLTSYADSLSSLTLTDAEMQKLKQYFPAEDTHPVVWMGDPILVELPIAKEKRILFPTSVSVDIKGALLENQLRLLNNDRSLYLTALKAFPMTRMYVTLKETGEVIFIDLITKETASDRAEKIDIKKNNHHADLNKDTVLATTDAMDQSRDTNPSNEEMNFADVIRFAWQEVYAPERLIQNAHAFARAPMHTEKFVSDLVYGDKVIAYPESAWVAGNTYVTAILLRNKYPHRTHIDIRKDLCGDWQAGAMYPTAYLKPYGDKMGDSAMLFLVSHKPFGETMEVCHGHA